MCIRDRSPLAVVVGAIPGAIPPIMGWASATGEIGLLGWFLFAVLFVWQIPHFMAISICYAEDYDAAGIKVYSNVWGFKFTRLMIFILTICLFIVCYSPMIKGLLSPNYWKAALFFNLVFTALAVRGFFIKRDLVSEKAWAKSYFWGSIFYLPLVLCSALFLH